MEDVTKEAVSEEGATSTEQSQSAEVAEDTANTEAPAEAKTEPEAEPSKEVPAVEVEEAPAGAGYVAPVGVGSVEDRIAKLEEAHAAFVKKLDDQYAIR